MRIHPHSSLKALALALLASLALAACGGGGSGTQTAGDSGDPPPSVAEPVATIDGFYEGRTSLDQSVTGVILSDNSFFLLYSQPNDPATLTGAVFGSGDARNGSFSSTAQDIRLDGSVQAASLSASYEPKKSFDGTLSYADNSSATFTASYNPAYETTPTLAALAGVYHGTIATPGRHEDLTLTVDSEGNMSGPLLCGCNVSALAAPLETGNAYRVKIEFTGGDHPLSNQVFAGIAYLDAARGRLVLIGRLQADQAPAIYAGKRQ
ncbi:MAG: hypothetical protein WBG17_03100 [Burkholderiaceae bacterium]